MANLYEIYFSPTGGTKRAADLLMRPLEGEKQEIDLCRRALDFSAWKFRKEDICVIAVPSYGGRVPALAADRLRKMDGGGARAVLAAVYGNRDFEDTLLELENTLKSAGFRCVSAAAAVAEHSIMRQFGAGRPDAEDEKELEIFGEEIRERLKQGDAELKDVPGNRPYKEYHGVPFKPRGNKYCSSCGLCASKCPAGAIPMDNLVSVDENKCISCMRCVMVCPQHARELNKVMLFAASQKMKKACGVRKKNQLW